MRQIFLIFLLLWISGNASAQPKTELISVQDKGRISVVVPNTCPVFLGENIKYIGFYYRNSKLTDIVFNFEKPIQDLNFDPDTNTVALNRGFDLTIKGDVMLMYNQFPDLVIPQMPRAMNQTYLGAQDTTMKFSMYRIDMHRDSTIYTYFRGTEIGHGFSSGLPAKFNGDFQGFRDGLKKSTKRIEPIKDLDSALVYETVVSKKGELDDIKLIIGRSSKFSKLVEESLKKARWVPAFQSSTGALMRVKMRIYVELCQDGEIVVKLPNKLYNHTGD
ncbi:hypothetical protein BC792_11727 [Sphingobacterium allocomposti]|uniref:TonB-like protein n=1 Tax=Sphingobacterium allocomposti TaxID=415956 RepID=A0A5S5DC14_9SPHI|nr:hypothetical protein [Sphingobacterium composti Yoo et al. 2007 non Ten et al. 2007]TYP92252.1 hypothetical protein BC792_11727 [Sphingobacterium composti Yoo et al. 2007 non Ten et al. 2007]